jgi:uncharacterized membrane protein YqiK
MFAQLVTDSINDDYASTHPLLLVLFIVILVVIVILLYIFREKRKKNKHDPREIPPLVIPRYT